MSNILNYIAAGILIMMMMTLVIYFFYLYSSKERSKRIENRGKILFQDSPLEERKQ